MAWLPSLTTQRINRSGLFRKDAMTRRAATIAPFHYGRPYLSSWDVERAVRDGYERVIWVFRCIDAIASNIAGLDFMFRQGHPIEGDPLPRHPLLKVLNRQVNPFETHEAFMYRLVSQYLLSKRGAYVEVRYDRAGNPRHLYLLPPHLTNPIPDPETFVSGYEVRIGGFTAVTVPARDERTGKPRVLWIRKPHPLDPYSGVTPLESAGVSIDTDFYARLFNRKFMANDGRPGGIFVVKGDIDDDDKEVLRARFSGGPDQAGRTSVISADEGQFVDMTTTQRDAQYVESMTLTKNDILLAFGTPESVLGNASNRTFDNADAEKAVFWQETVIPHMRLIAGWMDALDADEESFLTFDTSSVTVLQRHKQAREAALADQVEAGLISPDEWREDVGRPAFDQPQSRALWKAQGYTPYIPAKGDEDALAPPPPPNAMSPDGTPLRVGADGKPLDPQPDEEAIAKNNARAAQITAEATAQVGAGPRPRAALGSGSDTNNSRPRQIGATPQAKSAFGQTKALNQATAGTMVALFPPAPVARRLALGTPDAEAADDLHVTLAYLGKGELDIDRLQKAVANFALGAEPIEGRISGYGRFDIGDGEHAVYASVDSPALPEFRARLVATLESFGFDVAKNHGFTPHVTLEYVGADAEDPAMPERMDVTFGTITVARGPDRQTFRLGGRKALPQPVVAAVADRMDVPRGGRFVLVEDPDEAAFGQLTEALRAAGFTPAE